MMPPNITFEIRSKAIFELFVQEELALQKLCIFSKQKIKAPASFYLVCPESNLKKQKVKKFREWLLNQMIELK